MASPNGETTVLVYQYGTVPARIAPVRGEEAADRQLRLAGRLWNTLVAIECARIARYRIIMRDEGQELIDSLKHQLAEARQALKDARQVARKRSVEDKGMAEAIQSLRGRLGAAIEAQKATSTTRHEAKRAELTALGERTKHRIKRARQAAASMGLFWGTYNDIVGRADTGRKAGDLQFRRHTGDGTLTAQIMGGALALRCIGGTHSFFSVDPPTPGQRWTMARMRIGSTETREPVWLEIPIVLHRPVPDVAMIKSVSMTRRAGRWRLNITALVPAAPASRRRVQVAIDIGWRLMDTGVRVAYWQDTSGAQGAVEVSASDLTQFDRVRKLRSTCDLHRDEFLPALAEWVTGLQLPDEWQAKTKALAQWRSGDRLADLIRWWMDHRLDGDGEVFSAAVSWRKQYLHLSRWWRSLDEQMRGRLREQYRIFAAGLTKRYGTVFIEQFDMREVVKSPEAEAEAPTAAARYRQIVSPSVFRGAVVNACGREGVTVVKLDPAFSTRRCHVCGKVDDWDQAADLKHQCSQCGTTWDQDANAAANLLLAGLGLARGEAAPTQDQPVKQRKWDRIRERSQAASQAPPEAGLA